MTVNDDIDVARRALAMIREVQGAHTLDATLRAVVDGVVNGLGFGVAVVNLLRPDGSYRTAAVAGSDAATRELLDRVSPGESIDRELRLAEPWGELLFVHHSKIDDAIVRASWVPDIEVGSGPDAWHPLDALFAPLRGPEREFVGFISVDLPTGGQRPGALQREMLEMFADQASVALERARLTEQVRESALHFRLAFEGAANGMAITEISDDGTVVSRQVNPALSEVLRYPAERLLTMRWSDTVHPDDVTGAARLESLRTEFRREGGVEHEYLALRGDGTAAWLAGRISLAEDPATGKLLRVVTLENIDGRKNEEFRLAALAQRDALTGVYNRSMLDKVLGDQHRRITRDGRPGAVLFCDIDSFKKVNDTFGHDFGDLVLVEVARRLTGRLRDDDAIVRIGGDEFLLVVEGIEPEGLASFRDRIRAAMDEPITRDGKTAHVRLSVGSASQTTGPYDTAKLLRLADEAMYAEKRSHRES